METVTSSLPLIHVHSTAEHVYSHFAKAIETTFRRNSEDFTFCTISERTLTTEHLEEYLRKTNIPYSVRGGISGYGSELPPRCMFTMTESTITEKMKFGIFHIHQGCKEKELFICIYGPDNATGHVLTFAALISMKEFEHFLHGLRKFHVERIRMKKGKILSIQGKEIDMARVSWDDVILPDKIKDKVRISIDSFFSSRHIYDNLGIPYKRGIIIAGPPGNGKTMLCKAIAWEVGQPFILFPLTEASDDYDLDIAFESAQELAPSIVCIEDLDSLRETKISHSYFLNKIDGFEALSGVLILATTNKPEEIDPALSNRPSRFDSIFRIDYPDYDCRLKMLKQYFRGLICEDILSSLAQKTRKFSMAYLKEMYLFAAMMAANHGNGSIENDDILKALDMLKQQILSSNKPFDLQNKPRVGVGIN